MPNPAKGPGRGAKGRATPSPPLPAAELTGKDLVPNPAKGRARTSPPLAELTGREGAPDWWVTDDGPADDR